MARRSRLTATLDKAIDAASREILTNAIGAMPAKTTVGELFESLTKSRFSDEFKTMAIGDLAAALNGKATTPAVKRGRRAAATTSRRTASAARKRETRTQAGREAFDADVRAFLQAQTGPARAEAIRGAVGGSPAQVRQALDRMREAGQVTRKGQKRATEYTWRGGAGRARKKTTRGGAKRKTTKKRTTKRK